MYIRDIFPRSFTFTSVLPAFFYSNYIQYWPPKRKEGTWAFSFPVEGVTKLPHTDPGTTIGPVVSYIFDNPTQFENAAVPIVNEYISLTEIAEVFSKVTGQHSKFVIAPRQEFDKQDWQMLYASEKYGYYKLIRDERLSRKIWPLSRTWEQFLRETGWKGEPWSEFIQRNPEYSK